MDSRVTPEAAARVETFKEEFQALAKRHGVTAMVFSGFIEEVNTGVNITGVAIEDLKKREEVTRDLMRSLVESLVRLHSYADNARSQMNPEPPAAEAKTEEDNKVLENPRSGEARSELH